MKKIYFVVASNSMNVGSTILRACQIKEELRKYLPSNQTIQIATKRNIPHESEEKAIFVWIKHIDEDCITRKHKNQYHVYDLVDGYVYNAPKINALLAKNICHGVIVSNQFMGTHLQQKVPTYKGKIFVIHHHWDSRLEQTQTIHQDRLGFGYMGSMGFLRKRDSNYLMHSKELLLHGNVQFIDTELGKNVTKLLKKNQPIRIIHDKHNLLRISVNFNCHLSIRKINSGSDYFATTAKLATAAALGHNIITTYDKSVADLLPREYPFILPNTNIQTIRNMMKLIAEDYANEKVLWNKGLSIMKDVKEKLSLSEIIKSYLALVTSM